MSDVYIDASVAAMPDAGEQLAHLIDTGHAVLLVDGPDDPRAVPDGALRVAAVPDAVAEGAWRVTANPETCGEHRVGLRTLLVGPRTAPTRRPAPRCDVEARDLAAAVLEILSRDVMG
jgi:hypothetical protein